MTSQEDRYNSTSNGVETRLRCVGLAGLLIALSLGGCARQTGDQAQHTRVAAVVPEPAPPAPPAESPPAVAAPTPEAAPAPAPVAAPPPAPAPALSFKEEIAAFKAESLDREWEKAREMPLFHIALNHIQEQKARLAWVECRSERCLVLVDVPSAAKKGYQPLDNPWFGTQMASDARDLSERTRWSYVLRRHQRDYEKFASARVDPLNASDDRAEVASASPTIVTRVHALEPAPTQPAPAQPAAPAQPEPAVKPPTAQSAPVAKPAAPASAPPATASQPEAPASKPEAAKPETAKPPAPEPAPPVKPAPSVKPAPKQPPSP